MNRIFAKLFVGIISLFIAAQVQGQIDYEEIPDPPLSRGESIYYRYETTWGLRDDPANKYSMGPGGPFKTKEEAEKSLQKKFAETKDNGFWSVTHGLITRWPHVRSAAGEDSAPDTSANETINMPKSKITGSELKIVDPGPSAAAKTKSSNELDMTGRYIELFANGKKAKVEFLENGEIRIVDSSQADALKEKNNRLMAAGKRPTGQEPDVLATGKWSQTGTAVTIETKLFTYMGTISGNMLEGTRTSKGGGANENWESLIYPPFANVNSAKPKPLAELPPADAMVKPAIEPKKVSPPPQPEPSENRFVVQSRYFTVNGEWTEWMDIGPTLPVLDVDVSGSPYTQARAQEVLKLAEQDWQKIVDENESRRGDNFQFRVVEMPGK